MIDRDSTITLFRNTTDDCDEFLIRIIKASPNKLNSKSVQI